MKKRKQNRRTYQYQIREHPQNMRLGNMFDDLEDVHNHFLAVGKRYYRIYGKYAGRYRLQPHLTKLLERTHQHWAWIPRDTLDAVIIRIHISYERFVEWIKKGRRGNRRVGPPKFKRRGKLRSAKFQTGYKVWVKPQDGENSPIPKGTVRLSFKEWSEDKQKFVLFAGISCTTITAIGMGTSVISKSAGMLPVSIGCMS